MSVICGIYYRIKEHFLYLLYIDDTLTMTVCFYEIFHSWTLHFAYIYKQFVLFLLFYFKLKHFILANKTNKSPAIEILVNYENVKLKIKTDTAGKRQKMELCAE